ncbi:hypothetical protein HY636_06035 [Candidatus Woesearchaeota archaeon]|nr:hypothetical protein [Candidatus Woesearchaeota archaeon]
MIKQGLSGLALIASLSLPSPARALIDTDWSGQFYVFSAVDPRYNLHRCTASLPAPSPTRALFGSWLDFFPVESSGYESHNMYTLAIKCDMVGNEGCFIDKAYDKENKETDLRKINLPRKLVSIEGVCFNY